MKINLLLSVATQQLSSISETPRLDAELLLSFVLKKPRTFLIAWPEEVIDVKMQSTFESYVARRATGEPLAYVTGEKEFWSLSLRVTPDVLIPRPETEIIVACAIERLAFLNNPRVLELGTGSGAISLALATVCPEASLVASDMSFAALCCAKENAIRLALSNIHFVQADWFVGIKASEQFDVIVSNPPYVATHDPALCPHVARFEPSRALIAQEDGYADLLHLISQAQPFLKPGGYLLLEHGAQQGARLQAAFQEADYEAIVAEPDLAGFTRVSSGRRRLV